MHSSSGPEKRGALFQLQSPMSVQVTGSFCCCSRCFTSRPLPSLAMGRSHSCAPPKSTEATAMPPLRPHCIAPGTKTALTPTSHLQPPSTTTPAAPRNMPRHERPQLGCRFGRPAQGSPDVGASPIVCLAPRSPLLRAAYVLTGRNMGKQLVPSEPAVPHQESIQVPVPLFPSWHPHLQVCSAGVKFKLLSGTFKYILFS